MASAVPDGDADGELDGVLSGVEVADELGEAAAWLGDAAIGVLFAVWLVPFPSVQAAAKSVRQDRAPRALPLPLIFG